MKTIEPSLVQQLLIKDLESLFQKMMSYEQGNHSGSLMGILFNAKDKFEPEFMEYWFIKLLNAPKEIGLFFIDKVNYELFNFNAKTLGEKLTAHSKFLVDRGCAENAYYLLTYALDNEVFFDPAFLINLETWPAFSSGWGHYLNKNCENMKVYIDLQLKNNIPHLR